MTITSQILIVEDQQLLRDDLARRIHLLGYPAPTMASNVNSALEQIKLRVPDLIIMDIFLEDEMDGIELANLISESHSIPIVFLTGLQDDSFFQRAKSVVPYSYIFKPINDRELNICISLTLQRHALERKLNKQQEWITSVLHTITDAILVVDLDGNITFTNQTAHDLFGDVETKPISDQLRLYDEEYRPFEHTPIESSLAKGIPVITHHAILKTPKGQSYYVDVSASPLYDDRNTVIGIVVGIRKLRTKVPASTVT